MVGNWFISGLLVDGKTGNVVVLMGEVISAFTDSIGEEIEGGAEKLGT